MRLLLLLFAAMSCDFEEAQRENRARDYAAEMKLACRDRWFNAADSSFGGFCPRPDQTLTFEKDTDGDANIICRCKAKAATDAP